MRVVATFFAMLVLTLALVLAGLSGRKYIGPNQACALHHGVLNVQVAAGTPVSAVCRDGFYTNKVGPQ